jgi:hypothetical protein
MTKLDQAVALAKRVKHILIATSDINGVPHIAAAGAMVRIDNSIGIYSWYCPVSLSNIRQHPEVSVVVWDTATDTGFQIIGAFERMEDVAFLDGYSPRTEDRTTYPQVERQIVIKVERILHFSQALHADTEEA